MISNSEKELIHQIEKKLDLTFLENETEGNLCFVENNADLRCEFKSGFTFSEFQFFLYSFSENAVEIPKNVEEFWKRVEWGKAN